MAREDVGGLEGGAGVRLRWVLSTIAGVVAVVIAIAGLVARRSEGKGDGKLYWRVTESAKPAEVVVKGPEVGKWSGAVKVEEGPATWACVPGGLLDPRCGTEAGRSGAKPGIMISDAGVWERVGTMPICDSGSPGREVVASNVAQSLSLQAAMMETQTLATLNRVEYEIGLLERWVESLVDGCGKFWYREQVGWYRKRLAEARKIARERVLIPKSPDVSVIP